MELCLSHELLAEDEQTRANSLAKYFGQLTVHSKRQPNGWQLSLTRAATAASYLDPDLLEGLAWWAATFGAVEVKSIFSALYRDSVLQIALEDSWTLYSWSLWLQRITLAGAKPVSITVLHLDEHDDLMPPRLIANAAGWFDPITGAVVDLLQPESVASAIASGAIGIGNFIAPLAHWLPGLHIRHLRQTPGAQKETGGQVLRRSEYVDTLLVPGGLRPALQVHPSSFENDPASLQTTHSYACTTDITSWLQNLPEGPILLHIDLDYFNNRFDGNPDWHLGVPDLNPPLAQVLHRMDEVFAALSEAQLVHRIVDVTVAVSPGFFPATMWAPAVQHVMAHTHRMRTTL